MIGYVVVAITALAAIGLGLALPRAGVGLSWLGGLALVYLGQRTFGGGETELVATGAGLLVIAVSFALRVRALGQVEGASREGQRAALIAQAVGTGSLAIWFLTTPTVTDALGYTGEALDRWTVSWTAVFPILGLAGALPMLLLDQALAAHPVALPPVARTQAVASGVALAFGLSLVIPVNYLASEHDADWDVSYFRVTDPGQSTLALAGNLSEPVEALLFYPPNSDTKEELVPYFDELAAASGGKLDVRVVDQPMVPALAKELTVRDNGYVVLRKGEATQKFKIDTELKKARRDLKKLDGTVQKHLLKLVKDKRTAYVLTGHGEAGPREANPFFKLGELKQALIAQNYDVKDFGLDEGSAEGVPDDAAFVLVGAPETSLFPEEVKALEAYLDRGGALLVYADTARDRMTDLLGYLGVEVGEHPLANASKFVPISGGIVDRANLATQRYGSHATTATLSKYATRDYVVLLSSVAVRETGTTGAPGPAKHTPIIRSYEDTWEDADGDFQQGPDEKGEVHVLAMAVQGPEEHPYRAVVLGDVSMASDIVLTRSKGSAILAVDTVRWLVGDEDLAGEISNEEDVRIEHTREGDQLWFYGTLFGVPVLVLALGGLFVTRRRRTGREEGR